VAQFVHVGVPVKSPQAGETYVEPLKVHITNPDAHPLKFEYLRFEAESPIPEAVQTKVHVAYRVDDLDAALEGQKVIFPAFQAGPNMRIAFILKDGVPVEMMEVR
jgi:hypothetical protein